MTPDELDLAVVGFADMKPDDVEPDTVDPDELKPDDTNTRELDNAEFIEAGEDGPTGVDGDDASPDEVGLESLETEEVGSFELDGVDLKSRFGPGTPRVDDTSPSDVRPDDSLPDDTDRNEIVVKPEGVPDDVGPESERLDGGCVSDDIDPLDNDVDDRLGDNGALEDARTDDGG